MNNIELYTMDCGCSFPILQKRENLLPLININPDKFPDCKKVWEILGEGKTKGIFQLESQLCTNWCKKLKPENIEQLGALTSIVRPGVLRCFAEDGKSITEKYCLRKNNLEKIEYVYPILEPYLKSTYGLMIYQEQMLKISEVFADFNLLEQDQLRKAAGKKLMDLMDKVGKLFIERAEQKGILTKEQAIDVFNDIRKSGRYLFNHCISGDTILRRTNGGGNGGPIMHTVEHMYKTLHDSKYANKHGHTSLRKKWRKLKTYGKGLSLNEDGRIKNNDIIDIQPSGFRKIYKILCNNGFSVRLTDNHKIPTTTGIFTVSEIINKINNGIKINIYALKGYDKNNKYNRKYGFSNIDLETRKIISKNKTINFQKGENNFGYTNGSYSDFIKNKKLLIQECKDCKNKNTRLETHHINGDRTNSSLDNLELLCVSCHKKKEYKAGRIKKGEKGYLSEIVEIISIKEDGKCQTYDVTMAAPNHNFVVNDGLVISNSHAVSYGKKAYLTAYIKTHIPGWFYSSWLTNANGDSDQRQEILELVQDSKKSDIIIETPDILSLNKDLVSDGHKIKFGLADVKDVGEKQVFNLTESLEGFSTKELNNLTWDKFLYSYSDKINSKAMRAWISAGAFKWTKKSRSFLLKEFEIWKELKDCEKLWIKENSLEKTLLESLKLVAKKKKDGGGCSSDDRAETVKSIAILLEKIKDEDHPNQIVDMEEYYLGVPISYSRIDTCDSSMANTNCAEFLAGKQGKIYIAVEVNDFRSIKTKTGEEMAFASVMDDSAMIPDVCIFPKIWKEVKSLFRAKNLILIEGIRDKKRDSFILNKAFQL